MELNKIVEKHSLSNSSNDSIHKKKKISRSHPAVMTQTHNAVNTVYNNALNDIAEMEPVPRDAVSAAMPAFTSIGSGPYRA